MAELFDILDFNVASVTNVLDIGEAWEPVVDVSIAVAELGTYQFGIAAHGFMGDLNDQARIRFMINGGTWIVFEKEAKDVDDTLEWHHSYHYTGQSGTLTIVMEAEKESGGSQYDLHQAEVWIRRVA